MHALESRAPEPQPSEPSSSGEGRGARPALELLVDWQGPPASAETAAPKLAYGIVADTAPLTVALDGAKRGARRAKSCLVAPEPGDRVLCSVDEAVAYVLAVLDGSEQTRVEVDGALAVRAADLSLEGRSVAVSGRRVDISSDSLRLGARTALAALDELRLLGRTIEASIADRASLLAERAELRASRLIERAKQSFRFVTELEQVRAGHYDVRAEGLASVRGENTIVAARVLAKLDGEQVKIG